MAEIKSFLIPLVSSSLHPLSVTDTNNRRHDVFMTPTQSEGARYLILQNLLFFPSSKQSSLMSFVFECCRMSPRLFLLWYSEVGTSLKGTRPR